MLIVILGACLVARHPTEPVQPLTASVAFDELMTQPGPISHEAVVSAQWQVKLKGLVNLDHPKAAGLVDGDAGIELVVHVLAHPDQGVFVVDTGMPSERPFRGIAKGAVKDLTVDRSLADIVGGRKMAGVLLTHAHFDHVLGLPDVPHEVPVYLGDNEMEARSFLNLLLRPTYRHLFRDRAPFGVWDFSSAVNLDGMMAVNVVGDGSLWALQTHGHTPGSTSYLALTTDGPALFIGDTSHTIWGWDNGVEPGIYTEDQTANAEALAKLRTFAARWPDMKVYVGHELDGVGTGVQAKHRR